MVKINTDLMTLVERCNYILERERRNMHDIAKTNGQNCVAWGCAMGSAHTAEEIIQDIESILSSEGDNK